MPQLMPLNWMVSSILIVLIMISGSLIYSESMGIGEINNKEMSEGMTSMNWCW